MKQVTDCIAYIYVTQKYCILANWILPQTVREFVSCYFCIFLDSHLNEIAYEKNEANFGVETIKVFS